MNPTQNQFAIAFRDLPSNDAAESHAAPFAPGTVRLEPGYVHEPGRRPLTCAIVWEQDVAVPMRDGVTIYADVFRPDGDAPVPTIVAWTPYGKRGGWFRINLPPERFDLPFDAVSGLQAFEAPDPAYWVDRGYAVAVFDIRGSVHSEGDNLHWGSAGGRDTYDAIEWAAEQHWSNGRVGMSGNSYLAIAQWFAAAERPPHLAAIAPWEGLTDVYAQNLVRGGIADVDFFREQISAHFNGNGRIEALDLMVRDRPLMDGYWADKRADIAAIDVAAYVVASYSNILHSQGTLRAFGQLASDRKWLRIHATQEWHDYYQPDSVADLTRFFDRYLAGKQNDWDATPKVRMSVLDPGGIDVTGLVEASWPPSRVQPTAFYPDAATGTLCRSAGAPAVARYDHDAGGVTFTLPIEKDLVIAGPSRLTLWMEVEGADDFDVFAQVYKIDAGGQKAYHTALPGPAGQFLKQLARQGQPQGGLVFAGPQGRLRASLRALDETRSTLLEPVHRFDRAEPLSAGEIVTLDIDIWPAGMRVRAGETLVLALSVRQFDDAGAPGMPGGIALPTRNDGVRVLHTGGDHASCLLLPLLPPE